MKKNKFVYILFLCIIINLFFLSGCNNKANENEEIKNKVIQELDYLDSHILNIVNKLNNIMLQNYTVISKQVDLRENASLEQKNNQGTENSQNEKSQSNNQKQTNESKEQNKIEEIQMEPKTILESDENDIDWSLIKNEIEIINDSWGVIILDLTSLNIDNKEVLNFSNTLDNCILSIKNEDKQTSLKNLAKLYSFIPIYEKGILAHNSVQNIKQVKSYIINAYSELEGDDWDSVRTNLDASEKAYKNIINDIEYIKNREYKVNRTYVLIKELQNSLLYKNKKIFYIKYKNLLESINTL